MSDNRRNKRKGQQLTEKAHAEMNFMRDAKFIANLDMETRVYEIFARRKVALRKLWGPPIVRYYRRLLNINPFVQLINFENTYGSIGSTNEAGSDPGKEGSSGTQQRAGNSGKGGKRV